MRKTVIAVMAALLAVGCGESYETRSFESGDLDCADVSYAQAQNLIADGDPHGLDRDGDGEACEGNH